MYLSLQITHVEFYLNSLEVSNIFQLELKKNKSNLLSSVSKLTEF